MTKKRLLISVMAILLFLLGVLYYNNLKKSVLFENITSDNISEISIYSNSYSKIYRNINDKDQIEGILNYMHKLKIKQTDENAPNTTPDHMISFKDRDSNIIAIDIYGDIAFLYPKDRYPGKYRLYGFNFDDLDEVCEKLGINPVK